MRIIASVYGTLLTMGSPVTVTHHMQLIEMLALSTTAATVDGGIGTFSDVARTVMDLGITVCICAVVMMFLFKILNTMVNTIESTQNSILPELKKVEESMGELKESVVEAITKHNTSTANRLYAVDSSMTKLKEDTAKLVDIVSTLNASIQRLDTNIDSDQRMLTQVSEELGRLSREYGKLHSKVNGDGN